MTKKLRILAIAEAANPEWVSVPLVGWSMAKALRSVADVHIVTQVRNRDAIARAGLVEGVDFTAIDTERFAAPAYALANRLRGGTGKGWTTVTAIASLLYPLFEREVWKRFGAAIRRNEYDVVHRITPLTPTTASPLAVRCRRVGVPFVVGPLNGGLPWPPGFDVERRKEREWLSYVRRVYRFLPGRSASLRAAAAILVGSRHTAREMPRACSNRLIYMPENGVEPSRYREGTVVPSEGMWSLCFTGRLVPYKGPDIALSAALPLLRSGAAHFHIIGDGPMMNELRNIAASQDIERHVTFHGWVAHDMVQSLMRQSQIFVFPSFREFGGGAVLEAMALGLVPVVVDYGGPGELVALGGGVAVPLGSRDQISAAVATELQRLIADRAGTAALSAQVRNWALGTLSWDAKARTMLRVYEFAKGAKEEPPDLYPAA